MKILFGVSDWGLGHATRSISLIEGLLEKKAKVDIVSTGRAMILLKKYFGKNCAYYDIPTMTIQYPKSKFFILKFIKNMPRMYFEFRNSIKQIKNLIRKNKYDKVISDCRFDVFDKKENSILINHQIWITKPVYTMPVNLFLVGNANKFGRIIVPDFPKRELTGIFSNPKMYHMPVDYIGTISHLTKKKVNQDIDYFVTISGPEPQRTIFEEKILSQLEVLKGNVVIGLGKPEDKSIVKKGNVTLYGFLDSEKQEEMMNRAKFIISRPGYTTVMDIVELEKKKALFVPTPGQPEQEYFGELYEKEKLFKIVDQDKLDLRKDLKKSGKYTGYKALWKTNNSVEKFTNLVYSK
jgi:uncharacterized protein (TIGR00661 family)